MKEIICNIAIEFANICNALPRQVISNGLIFVKFKQDVKYRVHVYFEPVGLHILYQALSYLKLHN